MNHFTHHFIILFASSFGARPSRAVVPSRHLKRVVRNRRSAVVNFQCSSQDATDSNILLLTSIESGLPGGVEKDDDSASDTEVVWAKSVRGVWGLANLFANGKWYVMRNVPDASCWP